MVDDFVNVITSMAARIYGRRQSKRHAEKIKACVESVMQVEDLNVSGMLKNRKLSRAIADVGLYEFRRQLTYKAVRAGCEVKIVSRWFPSSKTCSSCGTVKEMLALSERVFVCEDCGYVADRDYNAAKVLAGAVIEFQCCCTASSAGTSTPVERAALA